MVVVARPAPAKVLGPDVKEDWNTEQDEEEGGERGRCGVLVSFCWKRGSGENR